MHQGGDKAPTPLVISPIPAAWVLTDEGLAVVLPAGLAAHGHPFSLPPTITLESGTAIRVHNNDVITHVVLGMAVPAGESTTWNAGAPGIEIYSDGCAAHSVGSGMTSLIITERRSTTP